MYHLLLRALMLTSIFGPCEGVHALGALGQRAFGGVFAGRQARHQRVVGQHREDMGCADGRGGERRFLRLLYHLLL